MQHHHLSSRAFSSALLLTVSLAIVSCGSKDSAAQAQAKTGKEAPTVDIHTAVVSDNREAIQQHIKAGTNINEKDPYGGSSPLISAALFGKTEIAKSPFRF